jgi:hypothetical protein
VTISLKKKTISDCKLQVMEFSNPIKSMNGKERTDTEDESYNKLHCRYKLDVLIAIRAYN